MTAKTTAIIGIPVLMVGVWMVARFNEPYAAAMQPGADVLNVRSARVIKAMSLGYTGLSADIYWTRAVQYYGDKRHAMQVSGNQGIEHYPLLDPLLEITVTLDPQLVVAYKFGAYFLTEPSPVGANRPDLAARLLHEGIANNPNEWRLWADLGMIYYQHGDYVRAADAYRMGSRHPHSDEWMKVMAAKIAQEGGTNQISVFLWSEIFKSTKDPMIRNNALQHLRELGAVR